MDERKGHPLRRQFRQQRLEAAELQRRIVVITLIRARTVGVNADKLKVRQRAHRQDLPRRGGGLHAEPPHAGVDRDRSADAPVLPDRLGADLLRHAEVVERADDAVLDGRRDLVRQQVPEDLHRQPERSKLDRLVDLGDTETGGPGRPHGLRHRKHAEPVGVRLQHRHDGGRRDTPPDLIEIPGQFL